VGIERMRSPKYWVMRAQEFHTKADNCGYPQSKGALRQVAQNYEELSLRARRILDAEQLSERRRFEVCRVAEEYADDQRAIMDRPMAVNELRPPQLAASLILSMWSMSPVGRFETLQWGPKMSFIGADRKSSREH
jgi:hypothetical protein